MKRLHKRKNKNKNVKKQNTNKHIKHNKNKPQNNYVISTLAKTILHLASTIQAQYLDR